MGTLGVVPADVPREVTPDALEGDRKGSSPRARSRGARIDPTPCPERTKLTFRSSTLRYLAEGTIGFREGESLHLAHDALERLVVVEPGLA